MDSNFQVTIQANIQGLQKSIKEAQSTLGQFEKTANVAANATKNLERNAGSGRLAAFAFGQVIRDAGFFANDFGLGLLAISNNIPILIDQLVALSNVSKGLGTALSLAGSVITAALTVAAYSMMYLKDASEEYTKELAKNTGAAQSQIVTLNSLLSIAKNEELSLGQRQDAVNRLNKEYDIFNNNLTVNGSKSQATAALVDRLSKSLLLNAQASALANAYTEQATKLFTIQNTPLAKQATMLDKAVVYWGALLDAINPFTGQANPLEDFTKGATANLNKIGLKNFQAESKDAKDAMKSFAAQLKDVLTQLTALETVSAGGEQKKSIIEKLNDALLAIDLDPTLSQLDKVKAKINAYQSALGELTADKTKYKAEIDKVVASLTEYGTKLVGLQQNEENQKSFNETLEQLGKITQDLSNKRTDIYSGFETKKSQQIKQDIESTSDSLNKLRALFSKSAPALAILDVGKFIETQNQIKSLESQLTSLGFAFESAINTESAADKLKKFNDAILGILNTGIVDAFSSSFMAIGDAISRGGNIADAAGSALLGSIANIAQQLGELAIGVGISIKAIKLSLKSLNPFVAIAAGIALLTLAGYARNRASAIAGSGGGGSSSSTPSGGAFGGARPFAKGGIISGDTLGLMGEYPNARSNPEVVAPLDKLTGIISGSLGDIGGNVGGQLTARISGNDLVILLDRASKNRKNYF